MNIKLKRISELAAFFNETVKKDGFSSTAKRTAAFCKRRFGSKKGRFMPSKELLKAQSEVDASRFPLISICVPLYNTPMPFLKQLIESVLHQSCTRWQLCLADASDEHHGEVGEYIKSLNCDKIAYKKVENLGISANTNAAATLAKGEYLALADHDDVLSPSAIYEIASCAYKTGAGFIYSDEALFSTDILRPIVGHFKPDFAPDYLNCCNYICHFSAFKKQLFDEVGGLDPTCDGSQDHDLFLKLSEKEAPRHIQKVLYYWRVHDGSTSAGTGAKPYVTQAAKKAIAAHLKRTGAVGEVADGLFASTYKINYEIIGAPLVSIMIPNKDHIDDLQKCLASIFEKTLYRNFEIIIIENNSTEKETFEYYASLETRHDNVRVVKYDGGFNFSAINNFGRTHARGDYLLLLNNDIEVINGEWLGEMLSLGEQKGVGIVGAMLYYPDDTVQHAGVIVGLGGYAGHSHKYARRGGSGYMFRLATVQNFSAVTAACMLVKADVYDEVDGLDEGFTVAFNDVDFCLRVRKAGYRVLYTPYATLYHHESKSRGLDEKGDAKLRFDGERARMKQRYGDALTKDEFYNPNLTLDREDFSESDALPKEVFPDE
ncbi:MAG: glycosyltransferase [Clostridia bacterium]|nr:glycosyltransferase [Clostridia bacterium]